MVNSSTPILVKCTAPFDTLRLRESLRRDLEEAAKERGVSLNQQITDCLERFRDRRGLLPQVLATAFSDKTAGVALLLARVMEDVGDLHLRRRQHTYEEDVHWIEDPNARAEAFYAAIAVLGAFPSWRTQRQKASNRTDQTVSGLLTAVRRPNWRSSHGRHRSENQSPSIVRDVHALLGPLAEQLGSPVPVSPKNPLLPVRTAGARAQD